MTTYMLLAPEKVKGLAESTLTAIKERRALMRKHQITNAVNYINSRWWRVWGRILFGMSRMTEEQYVEKVAKRQDIWNDPLWQIEHRFFEEDVEAAEKLLKMAAMTTENIRVSIKDMEHLWPWVK